MNKTCFLSFFAFFISFFALAQNSSDNVYIPENFNSIKKYLSIINEKQLEKVEGPYASKIKKIYKDRDVKMTEAIEDSVYFFNPILKENLDAILQSVYIASDAYIEHNDFYFFVKNSTLPNAGCYGDGSYEISLGLFNLYDTDDELAFVICHEIAHDILDHSFRKINNIVSELNSKETKQKIKTIERNKYGQTRASLALINELNTDFLSHSKEVESQADSLGFVLFQKTRYNPVKALTALRKLKTEEDRFFNFPIHLDSVFNFKTYPFKSFWLEEEMTIFNTEEKIDDFKMSSEDEETHPEIDFRIKQLEEQFTIVDNQHSENNYLKSISEISISQSIVSSIDSNSYDLAMYQLIRKYNLGFITEEFYVSAMATVLTKVYKAKINHELGSYVPRKNGFSSESELNKIRLFLHNLELGEVRNIGIAFCQKYLGENYQNQTINQSLTFFKL